MRRRDFIKVVAGSAITWPLAAQAQQAERMRRLGVLMAVAESDADARKGISILQERLQKLGWKDGNNHPGAAIESFSIPLDEAAPACFSQGSA